MNDEEVRKILFEQMQLLAERSKKANNQELIELSYEMGRMGYAILKSNGENGTLKNKGGEKQ